MNQQKVVKRFRDKVKGYLKSLCGGGNDPEKCCKEGGDPIEAKPIVRRKKHNFLLHGGLIKVSRKNVFIEEFQASTLMLRMPPTLEKHIAARIATSTIALLQGNFTDEATNTIPFALKVIAKQPSVRRETNAIISKGQLPITRRQGCIDIFLQEVKVSPIDAIKLTLVHKPLIATNHIFVCHEEVNPEQLHPLFQLLHGKKMIEIERVMVLDKCIKTVIYISSCSQFLDIDAQSLVDFLIGEILKENPHIEKNQLFPILTSLFLEGFCSEITSVIACLIKSKRITKNFCKCFLNELQQKYPETAQIVKNIDFTERTDYYVSITEEGLLEKTPDFMVRPRKSTFHHPQNSNQQPKKRKSSAMFFTPYRGIAGSMQISSK